MRYAKEGIQSDPEKGKKLLEFAGGNISELTGTILTNAARSGDELAIAAFNKQADWFGSACASFSLLLDPQAIVLGGGVVGAGELFLEPARKAMQSYMPFGKSHPLPIIIPAKFGNDAGLIGASDLVRG
jgi:glucokinase